MSLVGPKDDLVHERISDMATATAWCSWPQPATAAPTRAPGYPAAYEEVIAVTAVDRKGGNYDHANRGTYIDVAAPGVQILAALPGGKEGLLSGTSFAAPFVTAVVAVAYRDTGLEKAAKEGRGRSIPRGVMLAQLFGKDELKKRRSDLRIRLGQGAGDVRGAGGWERLLGVRRQADAVGADSGHGAGAASGGVDRAGQLARADDRSAGVPAGRGCEVVHWGWTASRTSAATDALWRSAKKKARFFRRPAAGSRGRRREAGQKSGARSARKGDVPPGPPSTGAAPLWCGVCQPRGPIELDCVGWRCCESRDGRCARPGRFVTAGLVSRR